VCVDLQRRWRGRKSASGFRMRGRAVVRSDVGVDGLAEEGIAGDGLEVLRGMIMSR
jgi:hypothetical protein